MMTQFIEEDGTPRYYDGRRYPLDIQCASQAIHTLVRLRHLRDDAVETAHRVALWTLGNMQDKEGFFYFRKYPLITNKTPMFHWGQATMLAALSELLLARTKSSGSAHGKVSQPGVSEGRPRQ